MTVVECLRKRVRELRESRGWTQSELAHQAGVPQPLLWRIENAGLKRVDVVQVRKLARCLGVTVDYLVGTREPDVERAPAQVA